jgi:endonuclease YncB( thermonuclease family)
MIAQQKEQTQQQSMKTQAHATVNNAVLARLMNEVRVEKSVGDRYDRAHNRHNR